MGNVPGSFIGCWGMFFRLHVPFLFPIPSLHRTAGHILNDAYDASDIIVNVSTGNLLRQCTFMARARIALRIH